MTNDNDKWRMTNKMDVNTDFNQLEAGVELDSEEKRCKIAPTAR